MLEVQQLHQYYGGSHILRGLSFEFTTIQRDVARRCLQRLAALGPYRFNACLGEETRFLFPRPRGAAEMAGWLDALPQTANSGDIYASLEPGRLLP